MAIRLFAIFLAWRLPFTPDAQDYVVMARQLAGGEHFVPYWPPGLPLYLALFVKAGASDGVIRLGMLLFWVVLVLALRGASKMLGIERIGWAVLLAFSLTPAAIQLSITPLTQMPVAALLLMAVVAMLFCIHRDGIGPWLAAGVAVAASTLVRPSAAVLLLLLLVPALKRRKWLEPVLACVITIALLGVWVGKAHHICGAWVFNTANTRNLWYGNNPDTPMYRTWYFGSHAKLGSEEIERFPVYKATLSQVSALPPLVQQERFKQLAEHYIAASPGAFVLRTLARARCFWGFDTFTALSLRWFRAGMFPLVLLLEAFLYCSLMLWAVARLSMAAPSFWKSPETVVLVGSALLYAAPYWISMSHPTYHFPIVLPLLLAGASVGSRLLDHSRLRICLVCGAFLAIQVEWVYQMLRSS